MPKGYWIAHVDVADAEGYKAYRRRDQRDSLRQVRRAVSACARGETSLKEGALRSRHVVIEFKDYATALACYQSEEYRRAQTLREAVSQGDLVVVEGYDGAQPG